VNLGEALEVKGLLDQAIESYEKTVQERCFHLPRLLSTPIIVHRMPDDPRFNAVLDETGLNKYQILG
jgi:hypothetical protein